MPDSSAQVVSALSDFARVVLNFRLVAGLITMGALTTAEQPVAAYLALVGVMAMALWLLLRWSRVGPVLVQHPAALGVDVLVAHAALVPIGVDSPFVFVVAGSAAFCGLCLGLRGAVFFVPVFVCLWFTAVSLSPPSVGPEESLAAALLVNPALVLGALFGGVAVRELLLRLLHAENEASRVSRSAAASEERARLARELHDSLAKSLHGIALIADSLPMWTARDPGHAGVAARAVSRSARQAVAESRRILQEMRADDLREPLDVAVRRVVGQWSSQTGRPVDSAADAGILLGPAARYELLAVLGECLENIARHVPRSAAVAVRLTEDGGWLELLVEDDGPGFLVPDDVGALAHAGHYGVVGMHERARRIGGELHLSPRPGEGVRVLLRAPVEVPLSAAPGVRTTATTRSQPAPRRTR